jgi:S1-C subfamily serine protease
VPFAEQDVSRDQRAAQEMVHRSGQTGVPVITVDENVIVGFDQARLERLIPKPAGGSGRLGASVRGGPDGLLVGAVHGGTAAERAGLRSGDVIDTVEGVSARTPEQLQERLRPAFQAGRSVELGVRRGGQSQIIHLMPPFN